MEPYVRRSPHSFEDNDGILVYKRWMDSVELTREDGPLPEDKIALTFIGSFREAFNAMNVQYFSKMSVSGVNIFQGIHYNQNELIEAF